MVRKFLEDIFRRKLDVLHSARVVHTLYQQQKQGKYCDLKVLVEDRQYFVHRCVLASASAQLDAQINGLDTIQLVGVTNYGFEHLLEILYSGKMSKVATVDATRFHQIVSAADALNAESVIEYCARERSDLMKIVLDQPASASKDAADDPSTSTNVTELSVQESLAVDSPAMNRDSAETDTPHSNEPIAHPAPSNGDVFASSGQIQSNIVPEQNHCGPEDVKNEIVIKEEPIDYTERSVSEERVAAQVEVPDMTTESQKQFSSAKQPAPFSFADGSGILGTSPQLGPPALAFPGEATEDEIDEDPSMADIETDSDKMQVEQISPQLPGVKCGICKRMFSTSHHLKIHMKKHTAGVKPFRCDTCGLRFSFQLTLMNHLKLHDTKKFFCTVCGKDFKLHKNLQAHIQEAHPNPQFNFNRTFPSSTLGGSSRRKSAPAKRSTAGEVTERSLAYLHQQTPTASHTSAAFASPSELDDLKSAVERVQMGRDGKYTCPLCGKGFSRRWNLKCHVLTHAENRQPRRPVKMKTAKRESKFTNLPFACPECGKSFETLANLRKHSTVVHPYSEAVEAIYCPSMAPFLKRTKLETPTVSVSTVPEALPIGKPQFSPDPSTGGAESLELRCWCDICGRGFKRLRNLRNHMETHTGAGYECHICGRTFAQKDGLNGHLWIHGGLGGSKAPL